MLPASSRTCFEGPFGEVIRATGPMAKVNPFRFSTKYQDDETDLLYYGYRYYKASTGTWLSRDPLNAVTGTEARFEFLENYNLDDNLAFSIATGPADLNDYIFAHNQPLVDYDLFGLCVPLPDSGRGKFDGGPLKLIRHYRHRNIPGATLAFTVCCPAAAQYLQTWGETAIPTAGGTPPPTRHGNIFPYSVQPPGPTGSGSCYTIVLYVPTTTATEYLLRVPPGSSFLPSIRIVGQCCCSSSGTPTQNNPPPLLDDSVF
ncbi:MAG: RHS repeat-associated core domain-containing protein [Limisphaerales bacterium]